MFKKKAHAIIGILSVLMFSRLQAQPVQSSYNRDGDFKIFSLSNDEVTQKVFIRNDTLMGDLLSSNKLWLDSLHARHAQVSSDGNFLVKMMWTDWSAPGKETNADVQVAFSKKDYTFQRYDFKNGTEGARLLELYFYPTDPQNTIELRLTYQLQPGKFYSRRQIAVRDTIKGSNWLDTYFSRKGLVSRGNNRMRKSFSGEENRIVKKGAFGQPCAIEFASGGAFFGVEYPAATTTIKRNDKQHFDLSCKEIVGTIVKDQWVKSKWVVEGLAPDHYVKRWFYKYLPDIRVAPDRPYALYNSWYDLRSPAFTKVAPEHIMNEKNILTIIDQFKKNMIEPYGIHLDAFVLDDGWDIHKSDWQLDKKTFPHGLKPISKALDKLGTTLGIWFGPTGGYSFRMDRINWMRDHGYEVTGHDGKPMLCIGGTRYSALFQKRTTDMVKNGGVGYFKWDGIQFSCSNPSHGHPIGYHSRRAILDSMIAKCRAVRAVDPNVYLNITSGTWLSPWWMKYANQIWMQGGDYGFAHTPSVNQRDASMTYKDIVLYNDFHNLDEWFPISNLMTHGIIKGQLNEIGGQDDPLNKFTDDAMFYFGRGVTMYELYISPDLLNKREWVAMSKSLKWAENRFPILEHTSMIGGDPGKGETYGYAHFKNNKGIIAVRNPMMKEQNIRIKLDPKCGINPEAASLVLERVYPTHWISPHLYAAGAAISVPLSGYESAVYEVYPVDSAQKPLVAGVTFTTDDNVSDHQYNIHILGSVPSVHLLNPQWVKSVNVNGKQVSPDNLFLKPKEKTKILVSKQMIIHKNEIESTLIFKSDDIQPRYVVFLNADSTYKGKEMPKGRLLVDGKEVKATIQHQKGLWSVYSFVLPDENAGAKHTFDLELNNDKTNTWKGNAEVWVITREKERPQIISITTNKKVGESPMPPDPYGKDEVKRSILLGQGKLSL